MAVEKSPLHEGCSVDALVAVVAEEAVVVEIAVVVVDARVMVVDVVDLAAPVFVVVLDVVVVIFERPAALLPGWEDLWRTEAL